MRRALFGGSFDPIHNGHLALARAMLEAHHLDEIYFSPAGSSPFKSHHLATAQQRLEMTQLAIEGVPAFKLYAWEALQPGPSYTISLIDHFCSDIGPDEPLFLILSSELIKDLQRWRCLEEIFDKVEVLTALPEGETIDFSHLPAEIQKKIAAGITPMAKIALSSTLLRQRLCKKESCEGLLPAKVVDYISKNQLYSGLTNLN